MNKVDAQTHVYWLETILTEAEESLSDWERNFLSDIQIRLKNGWPITDNQEAKLEQIYADKTS